jgi:PTH1 family peptidyl-tRNA hydrolase
VGKFLIIGLGNPGSEYVNTRHNIGFKIADAFVAGLQKEEDKKDPGKLFTIEKLAYRAEARFKGKPVVVIKPTTYMNLSGKAVNYWMQAESISIENMLVITDDLALPYGTLRMKKKGGDGGHNGLSDIITVLNSDSFARLRFGISNNFAKGKQVDYVLGEWSEEENMVLPERLEKAVQFIKSFISVGVDRAMSDFNNK